MRVLHVFEMGLVGGAFRVVESLSSAQLRAGLEPVVVAVCEGTEAAGHPILESLEEEGVAIERVLLARPRSYLKERREVLAVAARWSADIVHTHDYRTAVVDGLSTARAGTATVGTFHGFTGGGLKDRLYERLHRWSIGRGDAGVAVSEPMHQRLLDEGFPPAKLHVVRNALVPRSTLLERDAARTRLGVGTDGFRVGWVGRVSPEKGPDVLVEAIRRLGETAPSVSVLGEGGMRASLAQRATDRITWHGAVHGADALFRAFDVLVLSSRTEGTPMVLLEAMRAEVPVVATRVGGVPDVVSDAQAVLVPPEDPAALADAIAAVRDDPEAARQRAVAARERLAAEFGSERWVTEYSRVYRSALACREARR